MRLDLRQIQYRERTEWSVASACLFEEICLIICILRSTMIGTEVMQARGDWRTAPRVIVAALLLREICKVARALQLRLSRPMHQQMFSNDRALMSS